MTPEIPRPLDARINQGIMLFPGLVQAQLPDLPWRVNAAFDCFVNDSSNEFGTGLAFGYDITDAEILLIEHRILTNGSGLNSGHNLEVSPTENGINLEGTFNKRPFYFSSRVGAIALENGSLVDGYILSLHGKSRTSLVAPINSFGVVGPQITRTIDRVR